MLAQLGTVWPIYEEESGQHLELNSEKSDIGIKLNEIYFSLFDLAFQSIN
jgi:hypothetical protein